MYWILGGLVYILGVALAIRWLDGRWDPRRKWVRKLFAAHRREVDKQFWRAF